MTQELILTLVCLICVIGVVSYIFFSKVRKEGSVSSKESPFLGSGSTNSYYEGIKVYENLHRNSNTAHFKGDHPKNV